MVPETGASNEVRDLPSTPRSRLLTAPIGPTILRLAAPNMIAMLVSTVTLMGEAWYVGRLGIAPLAGLALAFPMMMLMMMLSAGSFGGTITGAVARRLGAGDRPGAEALAFHALLLMLLLGGACSAVFLLGGRRIYGLLGGSGAVLEQALAYSDTLFLGCVVLWLANAMASIVRATGHMRVAARCLVTGSVLQVLAAGGLVFGLGPLPAMGIAGAAAGILIGQTAAAALLLHFLTTRCVELRLRFRGMPVTLAPMATILKLGSLAAVNTFCTLAAVIVITAFVARLGVDALAGYGIGSRLELLIVPMVFGFGSASTLLVGVHFGAGAIARGQRAGWTAVFYSGALSGLVGGGVALFPELWAHLFTDAQAVRQACRTYLQIVGPFYACFGVALCLYFASQGAGRMLWPVIAALLRVLVIAGGSLVLSRSADVRPEHFYWMIAAGLVVQALVSGTAIRLGAWTREAAGTGTTPRRRRQRRASSAG